MIKQLAALLCAAFLLATDATAAEMPRYLRELDRPYTAGDWTLQCNGSRFCQIIGVAKLPRDGVGVRAVVLINRAIAADARPRLRIAFIDSLGSLSVPQPDENWRLYSRGLPRMPPPLRLGFGAPEPDGAYRPSPEATSKIINALRRWPGSIIGQRGGLIVKMPRGDLDRLFRKMDRLQHPKKPRLTAQEEAEWLQEYHHVVLRHSPTDGPVPDDVLMSCDTRTYVNQPTGWRVGPNHRLWSAECPEGYKLFLQRDGKAPVRFDVRDSAGKVFPHAYAGMGDDSLLIIKIAKDGDEGCGRQLKLGFSGAAFLLIEDRRYDRCRAVPQELWPVVWAPTSWRHSE